MAKLHNPEQLLCAPSYSQAVEVAPGARTLYVAGQVGMDSKGAAAAGVTEQTRLALANVRVVLKAAGMDFKNLVKTTVFMVNPDDYAEFAKTRAEVFGEVRPASTLVFIKQLLKPEFLVEIEAVAVAE